MCDHVSKQPQSGLYTPPDDTETALVHRTSKRLRASPSPEYQNSDEERRKRHARSRAQVTTSRTPLSKRQRVEHAHLFWSTMASITGITSAKATLVQLQQSFLSSYFSTAILTSHPQHFNIFYSLAPQNAALSASRDALFMIHLGSRNRHIQFLLEGQTRMGVAMQLLRRDLEDPAKITDDAVLGAAYTLGQTQLYMAVRPSSLGWQTHAAGANEILQKRGPESMKAPFAQALMYGTRPMAAMAGILKRSPSVMAEPRWMAVMGKRTLSSVLTDLTMNISRLLEKADGLKAVKKPKEREVMALLTELSKLEGKAQRWLLRYYELSLGKAEGMPYRVKSVATHPLFESRCGILAHIFPSTIEFPSFLSATSHVWVWTVLLVVRETILDVALLHPYPTVRPHDQEASLRAGVDECAVNLCQSVACLLAPENASCGIVACSPVLHFAGAWFERQQHVERLTWVRHVKGFLEKDILSGGANDTSMNISRPVFIWWMLPDTPIDDEIAVLKEVVCEEDDTGN